jgi:hypothetical protein
VAQQRGRAAGVGNPRAGIQNAGMGDEQAAVRGSSRLSFPHSVLPSSRQHVALERRQYRGALHPCQSAKPPACQVPVPENQSEASGMEAAIKKLAAANKRKLVDKTGSTVRKLLVG